MIQTLKTAIETVIDELIRLEVDAAEDVLTAITDELMTGDPGYDSQIEAIMDGIRWGARASLTVEIMNGAMVRVILPSGVRITHEWDDARKADPAIKAALEAIADARADMTTAEGAGDD